MTIQTNNEEREIAPQQDLVRPIQPLLWPLDQQLRKEALDDSLVLSQHWDNKAKWNHKDIIESAEAMYNFLKGNNVTE